MSLIDLASLVLAPTATKEGKVYSAIPDTGDGDLTFTRASSATRVNSAGLIEKVRTNLVTYSEEFSNAAWIKGGVGTFTSVVTTGFVDPNGGTNAQRWLATIASVSDRAFVRQLATLTSGIPYSISFWVKSNTGSSQDIYFMFQGGAVQATTATTSWQRISYSATTSTTLVFVGIEAKDLTIDILIYGFQLEVGDVMTDYIPTTSAAVSVGMTANVPRVDYSGGGCPSLLLEKQSTNLVSYSEQFDNAWWTKGNGSITANATTSPDGTTNADKFAEDSTNNNHYFGDDTTTATSGQLVTFTIFAKASERSWIAMRIYNGSGSVFGWYNIESGTLGTIGGGGIASITAMGNGWYRCALTVTMASSSVFLPYVFSSTGDTVLTYTGTSGSGFFVWGAQAEISSYATSYIPTLSAASTRVADACRKTDISSLIGQTSGSVFVESYVQIGQETQVFWMRKPSGGAYGDFLTVICGTDGTPKLEGYTSGSNVVYIVGSTPLTLGFHKFAIGYSNNDFVFYVDGVQIGTDTSGTPPECDELYIDQYIDGGTRNTAKKEVVLFKTRLTNTELADLTTL